MQASPHFSPLALGFSDLQAEVKLQGYDCHFTSQELWKDTIPRHCLENDSGRLSGWGMQFSGQGLRTHSWSKGKPRKWDQSCRWLPRLRGGSDAQGRRSLSLISAGSQKASVSICHFSPFTWEKKPSPVATEQSAKPQSPAMWCEGPRLQKWGFIVVDATATGWEELDSQL